MNKQVRTGCPWKQTNMSFLNISRADFNHAVVCVNVHDDLVEALRKYVEDDGYNHHDDPGLAREVKLGNQQVLPLIAARAALAKAGAL